MRFLAVSRCLKKNQINQEFVTTFHFKGFYYGHYIKSIKVVTEDNLFSTGMDYILNLDSIKIEKEGLWCKIFNYKKLF